MKIQIGTIRAVTGLFLLAAIGASATATAQDTLVALGRVESDGTLSSSQNRVSGVVDATRNGVGDFTVTVNASGAFTGAMAEDFVVELTVAETGPLLDAVASSSVSVTNDLLTIDVSVNDLEDPTDGDAAIEQDRDFFFLVRQAPDGAATVAEGTRFLRALGNVDSNGTLLSGYGLDGISIATARNAVGDYTITLTKPAGYSGDILEEHLILLTPVNGNTQDEILLGNVDSVADTDSVSFSVSANDIQSSLNDDTVAPEDTAFGFSIYRLFGVNSAGIPDSQFLTALANVRGSDGVSLLSVGTAGLVVNSTRLAPGEYRVTITGLGAFTGTTGNDFVAHASTSQAGATDEAANVLVSVVNNDTLHVDVNSNDIEQSTNAEGVAEDADFSLAVYSIDPIVSPDLRIGMERSIARQNGDGIFNTTGFSQRIKIKLKRRKKERFYFTIENDGNVVDDVRLTETGAGKRLKTKYFNIQGGGRVNVSGTVRMGGEAASDLRPGKLERFEGLARYRSLSKRPKRKLRITGSSIHSPADADTVKAKIVVDRSGNLLKRIRSVFLQP